MAIDLMPGFGAFTQGSGLLDGSEADGTDVLISSNAGMTSGWNATNATLTTAVTTAPDGTTTAALLTENSSDTRHFVATASLPQTTGTITGSIYAKANGRRYLQMHFSDSSGANRAFIYADLQTFTLTDTATIGTASITSSSIEAANEGFYKISALVQVNSVLDDTYLQFALSDVATYGAPLSIHMPSYTGDGTSGIYLWRPKLVD